MSGWKLRIEWAEQQPWEAALAKDKVVVGRAEDCDVILEDERVSKRHFEIHRDGHGWLLVDLGSRNGTKLNGRNLPDSPLRAGDVIEIGRTRLTVLGGAPFKGAREPSGEAPRRDSRPAESRQEPAAPPPSSKGAGQAAKKPASSDGPKRVEVIQKAAAPYAQQVESQHGEKGGRARMLMIGCGSVLVLGTLMVVLTPPKQQGGVQDNPLARLHTETPSADLFQKTRQQEATQLHDKLLAEGKELMAPLMGDAISKLELDALEEARSRVEQIQTRIAPLLSNDPNDVEAKALQDKAKELGGRIDQRASELSAEIASRINTLLAQARSAVASQRYEDANSKLQQILKLDPNHADARKMQQQISNQRAASAEQSKRQGALEKYATDVEQFYRSGVSASELGNMGRALSDWDQAEQLFTSFQAVPGAKDSPARAKLQGYMDDIHKRKTQTKAKDPNEEEAGRLWNKARMYEELGQMDKAKELWQKVIELLPNPEHRYHKMAEQKLNGKGGGS